MAESDKEDDVCAIHGAEETGVTMLVTDEETLALICPEGFRAEARVQCHQTTTGQLLAAQKSKISSKCCPDSYDYSDKGPS